MARARNGPPLGTSSGTPMSCQYMTIWFVCLVYTRYIPFIRKPKEYIWYIRGIWLSREKVYMWYIPGIHFPSLFFLNQVYTWFVPGISFPSRSVLQQNRDWDAHAHRFWIARCLTCMLITAVGHPSARVAAAIAAAADSDSEAETGETGFSPFSDLLLRLPARKASKAANQRI